MLHKSKPLAIMGIALAIVTALAWQTKTHAPQNNRPQQDTVPLKENESQNETIIRGDLDKALEQVQRAQENLERQLQKGGFEKMQKDLMRAQSQLNANEVRAQVEKAMKDIDLQKLNLEEQMRNIDMQKVQAQAQEVMQKINWEKMNEDMKRSQLELKKNIDLKKMEIEMKRSIEASRKQMAGLKEIDMQHIQRELDRAREELQSNEGRMQEEIARSKKDIAMNLNRDFKKEMEKATESVRKAGEELSGYKEMVNAMQQDGLLKADGTYNIKYKKGELYIDGVKQPENITDKYRHYFKQENIQLKKINDDGKGKTINL